MPDFQNQPGREYGDFKGDYLFLRAMFIAKAHLALENLALRQQIAVQSQSVKRPKLRFRDRFFWVLLSKVWSGWQSVLAIVQPETVIRWHRCGFELFWTLKSRAGKPGRPTIARELRKLIRRMSRENPTWAAPRYLLRDNDGIYGDDFTTRVESMDIEEVNIAPRSPWQNPYCERVIGSIRRECLDHIIVLGESHLSLVRYSPTPREVESPEDGEVIAIPQVGGLHHRYTRRAA